MADPAYLRWRDARDPSALAGAPGAEAERIAGELPPDAERVLYDSPPWALELSHVGRMQLELYDLIVQLADGSATLNDLGTRVYRCLLLWDADTMRREAEFARLCRKGYAPALMTSHPKQAVYAAALRVSDDHFEVLGKFAVLREEKGLEPCFFAAADDARHQQAFRKMASSGLLSVETVKKGRLHARVTPFGWEVWDIVRKERELQLRIFDGARQSHMKTEMDRLSDLTYRYHISRLSAIISQKEAPVHG